MSALGKIVTAAIRSDSHRIAVIAPIVLTAATAEPREMETGTEVVEPSHATTLADKRQNKTNKNKIPKKKKRMRQKQESGESLLLLAETLK